MQLNSEVLVKTILVSFVAITLGLSIAGLNLPRIGSYWTGLPNLSGYMLYHPTESIAMISYLQENPDLSDWLMAHSNELTSLYQYDKTLSLISSHPWLLKFVRNVYTADQTLLSSILNDSEKTFNLLSWVAEHPQYADELSNNPSLLRTMINRGYDEGVFNSKIKIVSPFPFSMIRMATAVNVTAYSPHGIRNIELMWNTSRTFGRIDYRHNVSSLLTIWNTSLLSSDIYTLGATATTGNGTILRDKVIVTVSNSPLLQILSPSNGSVIGGNFTIEVKVTSFTKIATCVANLSRPGQSYLYNLIPDGEGFHGVVDTSRVADGNYSLTVVATDEYGFRNASKISLAISNFPWVRIIFPADRAVLSGNFSIITEVTSFDPVSTCFANLSGVSGSYLYKLESRNNTYAGLVDTSLVADGSYNLTATAVDIDGSSASSQIRISVANIPWLRILSPLNGSAVSGNFSVAVQVHGFDAVVACRADLSSARRSYSYNLSDPDGDGIYTAVVGSNSIVDSYYSLNISVVDIDGSVNSSRVFINISDIPRLEVISPRDGSIVSGNFSITVKIKSFDPIVNSTAHLIGTNKSYTYTLADPDGDGLYGVVVDSSRIVDANYTLTITAMDIDGSTNSSSISLVVLNVPQPRIIAPLNGSIVGGMIDVAVQVKSVDMVVSCYANLSNGRNTYVIDLTDLDRDGYYNGTFDSSGVVDALYYLTVVARDIDGSLNSTRIYLAVSNVPWLKISAPLNGSVQGGNFSAVVEVRSFDSVASCIANMSGRNESYSYVLSDPDGDGFYTGVLGSGSVIDGDYSLTITVRDIDGSQNSSSIHITVSDIPQLDITSPRNGSYVGGNFSIIVKVNGFDAVASCVANLTGDSSGYSYALTDPDGDGLYNAIVNSASVFDGSYTLTVVATDSDGSTNSTQIILNISNAPQLRILTPTSGSVVSGNFSIVVEVNSLEPIMRSYANLNGTRGNHSVYLSDMDGDGVYVGYFDSNAIYDGNYNLTVYAVDVDDTHNSSRILTVISNIPILSFIVPRDGGSVQGNFTVSVQVNSYRRVSWCNATFDGSRFNLTDPDRDGIFDGIVDSHASSDGVYSLEVTVVDALGSTGTARISVRLDNVPDITILRPLDDVFVQGNLSVEAYVTSLDAVRGVVAYVDSASYGNLPDADGDGVYSMILNSTMLIEGYHTIYVIVRDSQGFSNSSSTRTIKVDNFASRVVINTPANNTYFTSPVIVNATIEDFTNWVRVYVNGVPVIYRSYGNAYVRTVQFEVDTSEIIFYTPAIVLTVKYKSALGHTDSTYHIVYKQT